MLRLALVGDVMLGREAGRVLADSPPEHPWGTVLPHLLEADLRFANLECCVAESGTAREKVFTFRAPPKAIDALRAARFDAVQLANNHVLDFGEEALRETLARLDAAGIARAGAGLDAEEAWRPALLKAPDGKTVGLLAFTDNEPTWAAGPGRPGVAHLPIEPAGRRWRAFRRTVGAAAASCDALVVAAHWGPNMRRAPSAAHRDFARGTIEAGAAVFWGTSAHVFQGIERHAEGIILYDTGDFVDDYMVDPERRNDLSFVFTVQLNGRRTGGLHLLPTRIDPVRATVGVALGEDAAWAERRLREASADFDTRIVRRGIGLEVL